MLNYEKVIVYGGGGRCRRLFETVPGLLQYVDFFVDSYSQEKNFLGKRVEFPDIFMRPKHLPLLS